MKQRVSGLVALLVSFLILLAVALVAISAWERLVDATRHELIGVEEI
jgi:divalent metal cation (Fe/Co/Zn/Cd) transporter